MEKNLNQNQKNGNHILHHLSSKNWESYDYNNWRGKYTKTTIINLLS